MLNRALSLLSVLVALPVHVNSLIKRYGTNLDKTELAIAYNGSLTSICSCAGQTIDLGTYNLSYIIAGAPLETIAYGVYGSTWEENPVHFGFFHSSSTGYFTTKDNIYGLQFSTAAWPTDDGVYDPSRPGERLLDLNSPYVNLQQSLIGQEPGYIITGDQRSIDASAEQPNSVGIYIPGRAGLPDECARRNIIFNWTQATPFNWSIGFSNITAWFNVVSNVGNDITLSIALNATRVNDDSVVRYSNVVLDSSDPHKPVFSDPAACSSTSAAPSATSSSAAQERQAKSGKLGRSWAPIWIVVCGFVAGCGVL